MNKHLKGVIAAAMTVTMMAAAAAPAGSMLTAITPVKSITASASLSGEYDFSSGSLKTVTVNGVSWKYGLNPAGTAACIYFMNSAGSATVTVPSYLKNKNNVNVPVRAIDGFSIGSKTAIKHLILPSTLRKLDSKAITNCQNLEDITVQSTLTSVQTDSVWKCPKLTKAVFKGTAPNSLEMYNSVDLAQIDTNGSGSSYPLFMMIAGEPCLCPYDNFSNYITANHWKFWGSSWMKSYISSKAHYIAMSTSYTADNDTEHIGNIFKYIDNAANENRTKVTNNKRYNGDTAFFFEPAMADSLGCAKAFDLIANAAGYESQILKVGTSINNPYVFLNTVTYQGKVYTIDAMHSSCMEDFDHLKARLGNYLPSHRYYLSPAELDSPLHTSHFDPNSTIGNEFLAVPYRFLGDVNEDGSINWIDCNMITDYMNGTRTLNADQKFRADFNMDGVINYSDVTAIRAKYGF